MLINVLQEQDAESIQALVKDAGTSPMAVSMRAKQSVAKTPVELMLNKSIGVDLAPIHTLICLQKSSTLSVITDAVVESTEAPVLWNGWNQSSVHCIQHQASAVWDHVIPVHLKRQATVANPKHSVWDAADLLGAEVMTGTTFARPVQSPRFHPLGPQDLQTHPTEAAAPPL
eukprot:Blabericola_migrator_1__6057@NODE_3055_length_2076_cov_7_109009_g1909_i0_p2_GENE_NODE_3055_length_2076_cov_7_109009_g1909_i0NODE_3055_length_2076_cov_7_109009_g1909_i0_p2_ORF_typecomplete_len172_score20_15PAP_PilO/PF06864_12/0_012ACP/PF06857_11/0_3ACP/PF06857_11/2e03_NODE_3055_length_2076_cov_7_109009_g1909_i010551570